MSTSRLRCGAYRVMTPNCLNLGGRDRSVAACIYVYTYVYTWIYTYVYIRIVWNWVGETGLWLHVYIYVCIYIHVYTHMYISEVSESGWTRQVYMYIHLVMTDLYRFIQPIADRVAQNLKIISKNFQFSSRRTRILMGFIIYHLVLIVNPMGRILVRWHFFRDDLEILCHPICNRLYM